ncbi:hypothetical protein TNCV_2842461 [Trichonephila clavipes]|nr:hypothetical protein TNCV_2842461 [Trichonephila clavipes]
MSNIFFTLREARRRFRDNKRASYSAVIKTNSVNLDMQDYLEKKLENMLAAFQAVLEKKTSFIMEAFQKTIESVISHLSKIFERGKSSHSPLRKEKAVGNKSSIHKTRASRESDTPNNIDMG